MTLLNRLRLHVSSLSILFFFSTPLSMGWAEGSLFVHDGRFTLEVRALPFSAVDAFFLARGFPPTEAAWIAESGCLHKIAAAHDGDAHEKAVTVDLTAWQVRSAGGPWKQPALKETWVQSWKDRHVAKPAQIAFQWALFPNRQTFHPGDRNWGMLPMGFAPATTFDLKVVWYFGEKRSETLLTNLQCASSRINS